VRLRDRAEVHRSSGVWVATAAGSTAAVRSAGGRVEPIAARRLQFVVREPYTARAARYRLLKGFIGEAEQLEIQSYMRAGRLYIDGPHIWRAVEIGSVLRFRRSREPLRLLGFRPRR
jgi:NAD+ kinase